MSSDVEFDDVDEEDLLQAISQVSQTSIVSSRPSKYRRISPSANSQNNDDIIGSDSDIPSISHRRASAQTRKRALSLEQNSSTDEEQPPEREAKEPKKKKKHLIHIPKVHKQFEDTYEYGTQAQDGEPGSSPYIARGARWKLPKPSLGDKQTRQVKPSAQKKAPSLDAFFKPSALKEIPSNRSHSSKKAPKLGSTKLGITFISDEDKDEDAIVPSLRNHCSAGTTSGSAKSTLATARPSRQTTSTSANNVSGGPEIGDVPSDIEYEIAPPSRIIASSNAISHSKTGARTNALGPSNADLAEELADIGSDFWTPSPEEPEITGQRLVAPLAHLRQTTLFGERVAQAQIPASQVNMVRQYRVDRTPEAPTHHKIDIEAMKTWVYPTNLGQIRDYQYSIVKTGLFSNTLVALPTGLGKTFIAATIMLNFYRWTTDAQIVFMAPTKPLVTQQVNACFNVAGIPRSVTTMLNGEVKKELREEAWAEKRVFFVTPQTFENDLSNGLADPKRIVLMVIDEAHKATGKYAYIKCIEKIRAFSRSFRVLALTATPGSNVEKVQEVIDGLEIAKIEIRTEASIDIQPFTHRRNIDEIVLEPSDEMNEITSLFSKAIQPLVNILCSQKAYYNKDPMSLTPFGLMQASREWLTSPAGRSASEGIKNQMRSVVTILSSIAHSIKLLKFHGMTPFYANLKAFREEVEDKGEKGSKYKKQIVNSGEFKEMMNYLQRWTANDDFIGHPKITVLCDTLLNHFMDAGEGTDGAESNTRVMVFSEFRDSAEVIVTELRKHRPMIKPSMFVGQADSGRSAGMKQSRQSEVITDFKKGKFNVLVATSIGEEGLDIGEVDLIVCYDTSASPIRMLQRMGRTGRKRAGRIVCLMMSGKEHDNFAKAKDNYEKMQQLISNGSQFAFRDDLSTRIVPKSINPEVDKRDVEIPFENTQNPSLPVPRAKSRGVAKKKTVKKFYMPDGVVTGFQKASKLAEGGRIAAPKARKPRRTQKQIWIDEELDVDEQTPMPRLDSVFLTLEEERELERCYQNIGGSAWDQEAEAPIVEPPNLAKYPRYQRSLRPTSHVGHSRATKDLVFALQNMHNITASKLDEWERVHAIHPDPAREASSVQEIEEEEETDEDLINQSMAVKSDNNEDENNELGATQMYPQSSRPHGSIALGSDTEGEDPDDDEDSDLSDFIVNDGVGEKTRMSSSIVVSSSPAAAETAIQPKPYYQPVQLPATQDTEDELPDIVALVQKQNKDSSPSTSVSAAVEARSRRRLLRPVFEDDSDE